MPDGKKHGALQCSRSRLRVYRLATMILVAMATTTWAGGRDRAPVVLKPGDVAPALSVDRWLKGSGIERVEQGKVYVIEFWGTWCTPCLESIPRLSKLQKAHAPKGLVVVGIASHEFDGFDPVEKFMRTRGDSMDYTVGFDNDGSMERTWQTGGVEGRLFNMPEAFVVGRDGKIVWVGHPLHDTTENTLENAVLKALAASKQNNTVEGTYPPELFVDGAKWYNVDGPVTLKSLRGRVTWLQFSFAGCSACTLMPPILDSFHKRYHKKGLSILMIDNGAFDPKKKVTELGYDFPIMWDADGRTCSEYGIKRYPTAYLIGTDGRVIWHGDPNDLSVSRFAALVWRALGFDVD